MKSKRIHGDRDSKARVSNAEQRTQEREYDFPYHYVSRYTSDQFKEHFIDSWGINYVSTIEFMLEKIGHYAPKSLLDIGCGDGRFTRELAINLKPDRIYGIDYSEKAINLARAMNYDNPNVKFLVHDIAKPWCEGLFDAIVLMEVLEHIPLHFLPVFLFSVRKLLTDGGRVFLTVPHVNKPIEDKHFQHFSISSLEEMLRKDFDVVDIVPFEKRGLSRKLMGVVLVNNIFILNNQWVLSHIYKWYKRHLFICNRENSCQRLYAEVVVK